MKFFGILMSLFTAVSSYAVDLTWSGLYRAEAVSVQNSSLDNSANFDQSYLLHHLVANPKIIAADGLNLYGRLDVFNHRRYPDTAMGDFFGGTPATGDSSGPSGTAVGSQRANTEVIEVSSFYLKWATEFGALVVGRAPLHFGLGITHNSGQGDFDHYYDNRDMVGYKFVAGNLYFMPMYGKVSENDLAYEDDVNDYMVHVQYDNPDTELSLGGFYQSRVATKSANDAPRGEYSYGGTNATGPDGSYEIKTVNLFVQRNVGNLRVGFESSFENGKTGIKDASGTEVIVDGYGLAAELAYSPSGKWTFDMKAGVATGDDPNTTDKFEGFRFDRNYDVGYLLFNHVLGGKAALGAVPPYSNRAYDVLGTSSFRNGDKSATDVEYLTNATYLAPGAQWKFHNDWNFKTNVLWAQLQRSQKVPAEDISNSLGVEWDMTLGFKPHERMTLDFGTAFFWPGDAFRGGTLNQPWEFAYAITTKAAVRF